MPISSPTGVFDILPEDSSPEKWQNSSLWSYVEDVMRKTAVEFGYSEICTPIFERADLFLRGVGETSDIVSKELYLFEDKGKRLMALRPEGTAPVMRSFIENQLGQKKSVHKLFYIVPMFRYDRPQKGRFRQHHQFGAECIGVSSPEQDVEMIDLLYTLYTRLGLKNVSFQINSLGNVSSRIKFKEALLNYLRPHFEKLSKDSQIRFEKNPLRILDSKDPEDQKLAKSAPSILDFIDEDSYQHFERAKNLLNALKIPYQVNPLLVRGLDYYNEIVFEVTCQDLGGAQNSIGGGGRYDGLLKSLGGPDLPAVGFGTGLERIIQTMLSQEVPLPPSPTLDLYVIPLGKECIFQACLLVHELRKNGVAVHIDFTERKLNKMMQAADSSKARFVAVIGDNEIKSNKIALKEMTTGQTTEIPLGGLLNFFKETSQPSEKTEDLFENLKRYLNKTKQEMDQLKKFFESQTKSD